MKATFIINQLTFELEAEEARLLFVQVAQLQEIFEAETQCGCCQSESIRYSFRKSGDYDFYELLCRDCGAQFRFGQRKGSLELFPKRKDEDGKDLPNHGWSKWTPRHNDDAPPPARRQQDSAPAARPAAGRPTSAPAGAGKPIPQYEDWDAAEKDPNFGRVLLRVGGVLYHVPQGRNEYVEAPQRAQ